MEGCRQPRWHHHPCQHKGAQAPNRPSLTHVPGVEKSWLIHITPPRGLFKGTTYTRRRERDHPVARNNAHNRHEESCEHDWNKSISVPSLFDLFRTLEHRNVKCAFGVNGYTAGQGCEKERTLRFEVERDACCSWRCSPGLPSFALDHNHNRHRHRRPLLRRSTSGSGCTIGQSCRCSTHRPPSISRRSTRTMERSMRSERTCWPARCAPAPGGGSNQM